MQNQSTASKEGEEKRAIMFFQIVPDNCEACGQKKTGLKPRNKTILAYADYPEVSISVFVCPECYEQDWSLLQKPRFVTSQ